MNLLFQAAFLVALGYLLGVRLKTLLTYFQQEEYDGARFLSACRTIRLFDLISSVAIVLAWIAVAVGLPATLGLLASSGVMVFVATRERGYTYKKPLVLTDRARRIRILAGLILVVPFGLAALHTLGAVVALQAVPLALVLANLVLRPHQDRINARYISEAKSRLERLNPVRIGITGSFGKTTVKHMLGEVLDAAAPVFYSKGSINTVLGLTRHIRERLQWSHRYFVAEMGAYGEGSIRRLCDFVEPNYGIVTAVGDAHTERFGSIAAIARAKSELVEAVCERGGIAVVNAEVLIHEPFARLKAAYPDSVVSVGTTDADVVVAAQSAPNGNWMISLTSAREAFPALQYEIPLLGRHNVINSALAVTMALLIDDTIHDEVAFFTKNFAQVPHRLQRIEGQGRQPLILDDAYNANENGFKGAVSVLSELAKGRGGRAILVTPGITELGTEHDRVHAELGEFCNEHCDVVYVVNPDRIRSFVAALTSERVTVVEVATFAEARRRLAQDTAPTDVVLYENDLPDVLEERRLL